MVGDVAGKDWVIPEELWPLVSWNGNEGKLGLSAKIARSLQQENEQRKSGENQISALKANFPELLENKTLARWESESAQLDISGLGASSSITVRREMADPAWANERIAFEKEFKIRTSDEKYNYKRAYSVRKSPLFSGKTVLDPTAGGGSIPFESMRLGCDVVANDLNPIASVILKATLDYPRRFGVDLRAEILQWGECLTTAVRKRISHLFPASKVPSEELSFDPAVVQSQGESVEDFLTERLDGYIFVRQVTCPHCRGEAPLFNAFSLLKEEGDSWGVRVVPDGKIPGGTVKFETYRVVSGRGPRGENPNDSTVSDGVGRCVHCKQAIDADEIKAQARGDSPFGKWIDRLYCISTVRVSPKLDENGQLRRYASGAKKGQIKTEASRWFRPPNNDDLLALAEAQRMLDERSPEWLEADLIPTEDIPPGHRRDERDGLVKLGITRWVDMFTPRQLVSHLVFCEEFSKLRGELISELGDERGVAVATYLQFCIDKCLDYNSKHTRWEFTRGVVKGTFGRHDFSLKWTFGEMHYTGERSGMAWGLSQVVDAYAGIAELLSEVSSTDSEGSNLRIINNSAASLVEISDQSIDVVVMDPPYYNNVQYAELSDYFYVWQKRTIGDLYPPLFRRRLTNKSDEAVANPARDGGKEESKRVYERMMGDIFRECRRVLKEDGLMTLMFTHKEQEAWETLTRSLIDAGWEITSSFPVESEGENSMHQKDVAAAASSIFITCRKRPMEDRLPSTWTGIGGTGVANKVRESVRQALRDFEPLHLNPVDRMVASYGRALQVLSEAWPVVDGNEPVGPVRAMNEAARVVAAQEISRITHGRLSVDDLDPETSMALTLFGIFGLGAMAFDEANNVAKSLNVRMESKAAGYRLDEGDRLLGYNQEATGRRGQAQASDDVGYHAPVVRKGSKLRLALPAERSTKRLERPQSLWDVMQGALVKYAQGDIPVARAYLETHAKDHIERVTDLLEVWALECGDRALKKAADGLLFGLRMRSAAVA